MALLNYITTAEPGSATVFNRVVKQFMTLSGLAEAADFPGFLVQGKAPAASLGSPEGVVTASVGALYIQTDGANGKTLWRKRTGTGNTGWALMQGDLSIVNVKDYGALGNGTTDDTAAIVAALAATPLGGTLWFPAPSSYYRITDHLYLDVTGITVCGGGGGTEIRQVTPNKTCFYVRASFVTVRDLKLTGGTTELTTPIWSNDANGSVVRATGASAAAYLTDLVFENLTISNGNYGIDLRWCERIRVCNNRISHIYYAGVSANSCHYGEIGGNRISDIQGSPDAYGITVGRSAADTLAVFPRSHHFQVHHNHIYSVLTWTGLDTHAGEDLDFHHNTVHDCAWGVGIVSDSSNNAPNRVRVSDNIVTRGAGIGSYHGILSTGNATNQGFDLEVLRNIVAGWVKAGEAVAHSANIRVSYATDAVIKDNVVRDSISGGITLSETVTRVNVSGNTFRGFTAEGVLSAVIKIPTGAVVSGNVQNNDIDDIGAATGIYAVGAQFGLILSGNRINTTGAKVLSWDLFSAQDRLDTILADRGSFSVSCPDAVATTLIDLSTFLAERQGGFFIVTRAGTAAALIAVTRDGSSNYGVSTVSSVSAHFTFSVVGSLLKVTPSLGATVVVQGKGVRFGPA